jgi:predicted metal-dependent hydrolase
MIRFIHSRKNWIFKVYEYYGRSFLGSIYRLQIIRDKIPFNVVSHNLKIITFHVIDKRKYKEDIRRWYKSETSRIIFERLPLISSELDLRYNRVSIKTQKSRWGSCSKIKNLNFNLLLAALPYEIIDYVIIHELMHLKVLNHSKNSGNWSICKIRITNITEKCFGDTVA